jgi:ketosteroid isomerase-like protein
MHENVEVVRRAYASATATHDVPDELFQPDVTVDGTGAAPDIGAALTADDAREVLRSYFQTFEAYRVELEDVLHADEDCVVTVVRDGGRVKGSEAEIWNRFFHVVKFRDNKIASFASFTERDRALEAAGLAPPSG